MSSTSMQKALWLGPDGQISVKEVPVPSKLEDGQTLIKVKYSGINPADKKHFALGVHSTVAGYDFCGTVQDTGRGSKYAVGDVIAGYTPTGVGRPIHYGTHQSYLVYPADGLAWKVPPQVPEWEAASLMVTLSTAADAVFNLAKVPLPGEGGAAPSGAFLVWGSSSSLGLSALQFAKAAGIHPIIATASKQNHALLKQLGATEVFDYKDNDVVDQIRSYVNGQGTAITRVLDAVGSHGSRTADVAASCASPSATIITATVHPKYPMPLATTSEDVHLNIINVGPVTIPARPADAKRSHEAVLWAVEHYGKGFVLPRVTKIGNSSAKAVETVEKVAAGQGGLGKFVIEHPLE